MRKKWLPITLCLTLFTFPTGGAIIRNIAPSSESLSSNYEHPLSVVTYNIRGCRTDSGNADPEIIIAALHSLHADVIALQEVDNNLPRSQFVNQVEAIAKGLKMNYAYGPSIDFVIGTYGNAVLSKYPIQHAELKKLPADWEPRSMLDVTMDWNGEPLHVLVSHLGVKKSEHKKQTESLHAYLQEKSYKYSILLGDFNMLPTDPLLDTLRGVYRDPSHEQKHALRTLKHTRTPKEIDRIFLSPELVFIDASAPAIGPSDHFPVQMRLKKLGFASKEAISSN
ncbi:endonuclease/exonuclease/phosphatase family protein [Brevibacillus choshinensis]|uniref:endonuclease/exonuclease/phosphatase family protein n=1 Tax=Brevibacillus choshinensis TaxID=54911 RepID=UPI002E1FBA85|nr:endonuclease/exonuclease/phosphatase family protein [Brevibacillus choshinensis]MED4781304.1 endonuclease/exonuclease/phosphatase family protein [Brevibacillus choshinensis]